MKRWLVISLSLLSVLGFSGGFALADSQEITQEQMIEFERQVKSGEINRDNFQDFLGNKEDSFSFKIEGRFPVVIDYSLSLEEMIDKGEYDRKDSRINSENFSISKKGKNEVELLLIRFNRTVCSIIVLNEMEKMGLRPARIEELLIFGSGHPMVQTRSSVLALGTSSVRATGYHEALSLTDGDSGRGLGFYMLNKEFNTYCRFLVVRK